MGNNNGSVCNVSKNSSTKSMYSIGASMVSSNSGLSWFDMPVNRENRNIVVNLLSDLRLPIIAVWLASRPINYNIGDSFEHWCVKIQAPGCLISVDFLESSGKGAFGLQQRTDVGAELEEFLYYGVKHKQNDQVTITKHKWEIIASVTPHPLRNNTYLNYLSDHDRLKLAEYMKNAKIPPKDPSKFLKDIKCNKRICDIATFCSIFTADNKGYNPITKNCQQFAAELFHYLVSDHYKHECERVFQRYQSPFDQKTWKIAQNNIIETISINQYQNPKYSKIKSQKRSNLNKITKKHSKAKPKIKHTKEKQFKQKSIENSRQRRSMQSEEFFNDNSPPHSSEYINASSIDYQTSKQESEP